MLGRRVAEGSHQAGTDDRDAHLCVVLDDCFDVLDTVMVLASTRRPSDDAAILELPHTNVTVAPERSMEPPTLSFKSPFTFRLNGPPA